LILGLLSRHPMSGYDIKRLLGRFSWLVGSPSFGSLYPTLHTLLEEGLVTMEVASRDDKMPRKVYTITSEGEADFRDWIDQPMASGAPLKSFVMRLVLADGVPRARLMTLLRQRRAQVAKHQARLESAIAEPDKQVELGQHLALDYGLALAHTELTWLEHMLEHLSTESLPLEVLEDD
jgi:DNA-binding PadR family transcriptional regulator